MLSGAPSAELLAPAGSPESLHAAVTAGADAVYLGLEAFNARRGAQNFTFETFGDACDYAHLRGVSVYVTLNTVILPDEVPEALECARQAYRAGADAFIVQDIGIAAELARTLPEARLHISTQMNTHNVAGIQAAAQLGAARVTLARELSLAEVAHLAAAARDLGVEVEVFAHGALCVCYSGQCLMSSMIGGRSANRGMCAQACRLPYELHNRALRKDLPAPGEHLLSPRDLCTIDLLPELLDAGVASLKIEGRMKSPDYVHAVTSVYRAVLDRVLAARDDQAKSPDQADLRVTDVERRTLSEAFSRGFTTAYLEGQRGNDIMSYQRPNNRGAFIGRIGRLSEDAAYLDAEHELAPGDVVEVWTGKGRTTHTLAEVTRARDGLVRMPLNRANRAERAVRAGDRVFRVRSAAARIADDPLAPKVPVAGTAVLRLGEPVRVAFEAVGRVTAGKAPARGEAAGDPAEPARTKAVTAEEVRGHIDRLGQSSFCITSLDIQLDEGVGIGFSQLHHLRKEALDALAEALLAPYRSRTLPRVRDRERCAAPKASGCSVAAWATNPVCARAAKRAGATTIYVPALMLGRGQSVIAGQRSDTAEQAAYPASCVAVLPVADHDPVPGTREEALGFDPWRYVRPGEPVLAESLGALVRACGLGAVCEVGPHVPLTNRLALEEVAGLGAKRVWLSPELNLRQIAALTQGGTPVPVGCTVIGSQELMVTEHCLLMSQGPCDEDCVACARRKSPHYLRDRKGFEFPVLTDALGRSHLFNSVQLDVAHVMADLMSAGVSSFLVDTTLMNGEEAAAAVARVVRARDLALRDGNTVAKAANATSGHLFRGVV